MVLYGLSLEEIEESIQLSPPTNEVAEAGHLEAMQRLVRERLDRLIEELPAKLERLEEMAAKPSQAVMQLRFESQHYIMPDQALPSYHRLDRTL